jgi:hypothetical protein
LLEGDRADRKQTSTLKVTGLQDLSKRSLSYLL